MSLRIDFDASQVSVFKRFSFLRAATRWVDEVAPIITESIKAEAPVGHGPTAGQLRDSITHRRRTGFSGVSLEFGSSVPHASYVQNGTPPHLITPRNAPVLRFTARSGETVYANQVNHPGAKANPFARRALERVSPIVEKAFAEAVESQFRKG